ncbi:MAG TPA: hypothetical protein VKG44_09795 [Candidatus Baltobacteraceae bacterium]|nr:hypothetical protein [Candidatus Baltobacteraceae bacterium]
MDGTDLGANVLPLIEEHFGFLESRGFGLTQTTEIPSAAWYRAPERAVIVTYDLMRDSTVDVTLELKGRDDSHLLNDILALAAPEAAHREEVRGRLAVAAEMARSARLLAEHCEDFLRGDLAAFRRRFREAILVKRCRELAVREFYNGDLRRAATFFDFLRNYWTEADREHYERAASGQGALANFRRGR